MTTRSPSAYHTGANMIAEVDLVEALTIGLQILRQDEAAIAELFQRHDVTRLSPADAWSGDQAVMLRRILDPSDDLYARASVGYPTTDRQLPCYSVVNESAAEDTSGAVVGDLLGVSYDRAGQLSVRSDLMGVTWTTTVQIGCWATAPELSFVLRDAARWALFRQKDFLRERGVHDMSFSEQGLAPSPDLEPRVGYVPMITITLRWTFGQTLRRTVPNTATARPARFRN